MSSIENPIKTDKDARDVINKYAFGLTNRPNGKVVGFGKLVTGCGAIVAGIFHLPALVIGTTLVIAGISQAVLGVACKAIAATGLVKDKENLKGLNDFANRAIKMSALNIGTGALLTIPVAPIVIGAFCAAEGGYNIATGKPFPFGPFELRKNLYNGPLNKIFPTNNDHKPSVVTFGPELKPRPQTQPQQQSRHPLYRNIIPDDNPTVKRGSQKRNSFRVQ